MATRWVSVDMQQSRPGDTGMLDTKGRAVLSFNAIVTRRPSATFEEEVVKILVDASVGAFNASIFTSSAAEIPTGAGPYLSVLSGGGPAPVNTQNAAGIGYERASLQVVVRAATYVAARVMAVAAFNALAVVRNQDVAA